MTKYVLFLVIMAMFSAACGKKSTVKPDVQGNGLAFDPIRIVVPLTEETVAQFDSPIKGTFNLLHGVVKSVFDLGAKMGAGKVRLDMIQPLPEIPAESLDYIKEIRVKRIFFYMEPVQVEKRNWLQRVGDFIGNFGRKRAEANFEFLNQLLVSVKPEKIENRKDDSWAPEVASGSLSSKEKTIFKKYFSSKKATKAQQEQLIKENGEDLVSYDKANPNAYLNNKDLGRIFIIYTDTPLETRQAIEDDSELRPFYSRILTLKNSLLLELPAERLSQEKFDIAFWDKQDVLNIKDMETCTPEICLDLKVKDINLVPLLVKENGIKINTLIDARKTPESFQLKGFIEFEVQIVVPKANKA